MNKSIEEFIQKAGIDLTYVTNTKQVVLLEKLAELIVEECAACCGSQADKRNIRKRFDLSVESNVQYEAPPIHGSVTSQYTREYNIPR